MTLQQDLQAERNEVTRLTSENASLTAWKTRSDQAIAIAEQSDEALAQ